MTVSPSINHQSIAFKNTLEKKPMKNNWTTPKKMKRENSSKEMLNTISKKILQDTLGTTNKKKNLSSSTKSKLVNVMPSMMSAPYA